MAQALGNDNLRLGIKYFRHVVDYHDRPAPFSSINEGDLFFWRPYLEIEKGSIRTIGQANFVSRVCGDSRCHTLILSQW